MPARDARDQSAKVGERATRTTMSSTRSAMRADARPTTPSSLASILSHVPPDRFEPFWGRYRGPPGTRRAASSSSTRGRTACGRGLIDEGAGIVRGGPWPEGTPTGLSRCCGAPSDLAAGRVSRVGARSCEPPFFLGARGQAAATHWWYECACPQSPSTTSPSCPGSPSPIRPAPASGRSARVTTAPSRLRGRGLPGPPRLRRRRSRRPRSVRPPRPDGRGRVRARRAEGHAVAPAPRLRDGHLHDRRRVRAPATRTAAAA